MTPLENYSLIIDNIFGVNTTTFDKTGVATNNVIGALNSIGNFENFKANFVARLNRLKNLYTANPGFLNDIIVQVNEIASSKNWQGAFAELAAYDYLNGDPYGNRMYLDLIQPNITLPKEKSFALELGKQQTNLDGFYENGPLYFDVKCLKDNIDEILHGIYAQLFNQLKIKDAEITAQYDQSISYDDFQKNRADLVKELVPFLQKRDRFMSSKIIPNLSYRILWGNGVSTSERTYDPYSHAENYHRTIFNYANKFMKDDPTFIVLVVFPWYNLIVNDFAQSNVYFYRSLARRVFCQYKNSGEKFSSFNSSFSGNNTIYDISTYLSGIIFLEDNTVLSEFSSESNIQSYIYLNPNAINPISRAIESDFMFGFRHKDYDTFEHDNY